MSRATRWSLIIAVLLGALSNYAIALFCLWWQQGPRTPDPHETAQWLWNSYARPNPQYGPAYFRDAHSGALGCDFFILAADPAVNPSSVYPCMMITRAGFPVRAFEGMHSWGGVRPSYAWAIPIRPFRPNVAWVSVLPLRPMLPGFVINTAVYGGIIWMFIFGPMHMFANARRRWRVMQGRCQSCGYDLRSKFDAGCPECGWRRANS